MRQLYPCTPLLWSLALGLIGCAGSSSVGPNECSGRGSDGATAPCSEPLLSEEHYVSEALRYFDTLDVTAPVDSIPDYAELVARWEWPPWLKLTGYGRQDMIDTGLSLREFDPSTVPERDCRFFDTQPFARCYVVFDYEGQPCPIYEEFTFNDAGETTFIEAWSDLPGMLPMDKASDPWAEAPDVHRLSNLVPGLGAPTGRIDLDSGAMRRAARRHEDVADFAERAVDWERAWGRELVAADPDFFAQGCGWTE